MFIALTGATGFLGRYLVRELVLAGHRLRCWYRPTSDRMGFDDVAEAVQWLPGKLGDEPATAALVRDMDAVVHAAVQWEGPRNRGSGRHGDADARGPEDGRKRPPHHSAGTSTIVRHVREPAVAVRSQDRFVFISTCAVHEVILDDRPLDETHIKPAICRRIQVPDWRRMGQTINPSVVRTRW